MLLSQISSLDANGAAVLRDILNISQFARLAEFREDGTDYVKTELKERSAPGFRAKNGSYTPENDNPTPELEGLKFLGKEAILDQSYKIDAEKGLLNLDVYKQRLLKRRAFALGRGLDVQTFAGGGTGNDILGFAGILDGTNVGNFGDTMVLNGLDLDLTAEANWNSFMELLDEAIEDVPQANIIAVNGKLKAKINSMGRKFHSVAETKDAFGEHVMTYNGIPIVRLNDGAIPNDERNNADTADTTTSLYVMRMEEIDGVCLSSNSGLRYTPFPELEASVTEKARMEIYYNITIEAPDAIRRVEHLKIV
ncbi:MAG: hypothetical protein JJ958_06750 [Balneola sp.]|nr:hypothetical protein [Balneola sp.]